MVCGAGVIGASVAYHLSLRGIAAVVVERETVAHGASGTAAGLLSPVAAGEATTPLGKLLVRSAERHRELAEELSGAERYAFAEMGSEVVAMSAEEARLLAELRGTAPEAVTEGGWVDREVRGVVRVEGAAQLDPGAFTRTLLDAACERGARLITGDVQGIRTEHGVVSGVQVSARMIETSRVIVATGPWSAEAEGWLRTPIPVWPLKGQILKYRMPDAPAGAFSGLNGNYAAKKPGGIVYAGTTEEEAGFDLAPTPEARDAIVSWLSKVSSRFAEVEPFEQTACLRPLSDDGLPLIGKAPTFEGAYVATGHGRKGIMLSAATGEAIAELIVTGKCTTVDPGPFAPGRFRGSPGRYV